MRSRVNDAEKDRDALKLEVEGLKARVKELESLTEPLSESENAQLEEMEHYDTLSRLTVGQRLKRIEVILYNKSLKPTNDP